MKFEKKLRTIATTALASLFMFSSPLTAAEHQIGLRGTKYSVSVDEKTKRYSIAPEASSEIEREILGIALAEELAGKTKQSLERLEERLKQFAIENPSRVNFEMADSNVTAAENVRAFFPYSYPDVRIRAEKQGRKIKLRIETTSQNNLMSWYKDSSIIILYPKGTKVRRERFDRLFELDTDRRTRLGAFSVKESSMPGEREVYSLLVDEIFKQILARVAREAPYGASIKIATEFENQLAKWEKTRRENVLGRIKGGYNVLEYQPSIHISPSFEIGRELSLEIINGYPEQIYVFLNTNIKLNPLTVQQGTQTKIEGHLLKLISLRPMKLKNDSPAGNFVSTLSQIIDSMPREFNRKTRNFPELNEKYSRLSEIDQSVHIISTLLDSNKHRILSSKISDDLADKLVQIQPRTLEQAIAEYRADSLAEIKRFIRQRYNVKATDIKNIFALNIDADRDKEYAVFFFKRHGMLEVNESEYNASNSSKYIFSSILEKTAGGVMEKGSCLSLPDSSLRGIKHSDYNSDGKEEIILSSSSYGNDYFQIFYWDGEYKNAIGTIDPDMATDRYFYNLLKELYSSENNRMSNEQWQYVKDHASEWNGD